MRYARGRWGERGRRDGGRKKKRAKHKKAGRWEGISLVTHHLPLPAKEGENRSQGGKGEVGGGNPPTPERPELGR